MTDADGHVAANIALVRRVSDEIVNQGKLDLTDQIFAADFIGHRPGRLPIQGIEAVKSYFQVVRKGFPDQKHTIEDVIAAGDRVVLRVTMTGTHRGAFPGHTLPTGRHVRVEEMHIYRVANGRIAERWQMADLLALKEQLGP